MTVHHPSRPGSFEYLGAYPIEMRIIACELVTSTSNEEQVLPSGRERGESLEVRRVYGFSQVEGLAPGTVLLPTTNVDVFQAPAIGVPPRGEQNEAFIGINERVCLSGHFGDSPLELPRRGVFSINQLGAVDLRLALAL